MSKDLINSYWSKFFLLFLSLIIVLIIIILFIFYRKKIFKKNEFYNFKFSVFFLVFTFCLLFVIKDFRICVLDYKYVKNKTYLEIYAELIRFDQVTNYLTLDDAFNNDIYMDDPVFYIPSTDEEICLFRGDNDVELNKYYLIRYWPNTKYFCVV